VKYIEFISTLILITGAGYTLLIGILNSNRLGIYNIFPILAFLSITQIFFSRYLSLNYSEESSILMNSITITTYIILEFILVIIFFYKEIKSKVIKIICIAFFYFFVFSTVTSFIFNRLEHSDTQITCSFIGSTLLVVLCMLVFVEIIFDDSINNLFKSEFFIITFSIFFFFGITYPFYALSFFISYDDKINYEFSLINNIFYTIFYFIIIKGMKCRILTTK
jgi:hypothetical protein